ncbi:MAG: serine--tRNA ligase [Dehalococcoidia bacterium]|nr:serine--tRNA ligase [Dehalococcoidia bacterium]NUQ54349.1 serine--tRNA ligase [Dehalococcoidia bacterium]RIL01745.1 MAG: serine--tRNA ligase [bacterium]
MLSIQFIRENTGRVKRDLALRHATAPIDRILLLDEKRRELLQEVESLRAERNTVSKLIGATKDSSERNTRIETMREVGNRIDGLDRQLGGIESELTALLLEVPNIIDPGVPPGPDERSNAVVETSGSPRSFAFQPRPHWELGAILDGIDFERGAKMSGSRFYLLKGQVARLQRALIQFFLDDHARDGFVECYLPDMLSEASLIAAGQLPKFYDNLYRDAEDDFFFTPTAEVPFVNYYRDEIIPPGTLPLRLVAHTPCFRREKMSAGRDVRGIKRGHQFEKVEMFVYCEPEQSDAELQNLVRRARSLPEKLGIPYRVVQLCSGDIGFNATKTYDIELWAPGQGEWLEVSSASNCLDFQARRANIRYRPAPDAPTRHPHMLNASGLALPRTVIAVMENYQQEDGSITVPEVLRPYMGTERIEPRGA